jgi:hypothetical protein
VPGDFLLALAALAPTSEAVAAVSAYFGFGPAKPPPEEPDIIYPRDSGTIVTPAQPRGIQRPRRSRFEAQRAAPTEDADTPPTWLAAAVLSSGPITHAYELPIPPLFRLNLARAILIGAAAQERPTGEFDMPELIQEICRGILPRAVPRRRVSSLGGRVQLLIDAGKGMRAFAADIEALIDDAIRFVGYDQLRVAWFHENPLRGVHEGDGEEIAPYGMAKAGRSLLIVSDLGLGMERSAAKDAGLAEWVAFADAAVRHDCSVTAIVPYPLDQVPRKLHTRMRILTWDRDTSVRDLRRGSRRAGVQEHRPRAMNRVGRTSPAALALAQRACLAARAEPQLLRALRLDIDPVLDVGAEADLYWSPMVDVHGTAGIVLRADVLNGLRQQLRSSSNLLDACWKVTKEIHERGPRALLHEEELTYLTLRGLDDPARVVRAKAILRELVAGLRSNRLGLWAERALLRLPRELFEVDEARMLAVGVARSSGNKRIWARLPARTDPAVYRWMGPAADEFDQIHVGLVEGGITFGPQSFPESHEMAVPRGGPLEIEICWRDADRSLSRLVRVDRGRETTLDIDSDDIELRPLGAPSWRIFDAALQTASQGSDLAASADPPADGTVFISYARADDEKPPFDDTTQGWVTFFWQQLRWELTNAGISQAELWLDRYDIEPAEEFTEKIEAALREARMMIVILSPNWVSRPWCQKELQRFMEMKQGNASDCVVLVKKWEPPESDVPEPLRDREGYKFFAKEPNGQVREFYWRGLHDKDAYFDQLRRIAEWISERMLASTRVAKPADTAGRRVVYVASPDEELRDAWQRLANDLVAAGYAVLPAEGRLPDNAAQADEAIRSALGRSEMSVHLLGDIEGVKDRTKEGIVRRQLRLAREHAGPAGKFPRILWAPKFLPEHKDTERDPFEVVKRFGVLSAGEEVYAGEVTDLSQWLTGRLDHTKPEMTHPIQTLLVAGGSAEDDDLVGTLANRLQSGYVKARALFANDPMPNSDATPAAAALVPWGKAELASINTLLASLSERATRLVVLRLPGGDEAAKRRFFREGTYSEALDALPPDHKAARELLARLEIVQPEERLH